MIDRVKPFTLTVSKHWRTPMTFFIYTLTDLTDIQAWKTHIHSYLIFRFIYQVKHYKTKMFSKTIPERYTEKSPIAQPWTGHPRHGWDTCVVGAPPRAPMGVMGWGGGASGVGNRVIDLCVPTDSGKYGRFSKTDDRLFAHTMMVYVVIDQMMYVGWVRSVLSVGCWMGFVGVSGLQIFFESVDLYKDINEN